MTDRPRYTMSLADLEEYNYRIEERLGILCEDREPTKEQVAIAHSEAAQWFKEKNEETRTQS